MKRPLIKKQSSKQAANLALWARLKLERIRREIEENGAAQCAMCGTEYYPEERALAGLHADHIKSGHGRDWTAENMQLLCAPNNGSPGCHLGGKHHQ